MAMYLFAWKKRVNGEIHQADDKNGILYHYQNIRVCGWVWKQVLISNPVPAQLDGIRSTHRLTLSLRYLKTCVFLQQTPRSNNNAVNKSTSTGVTDVDLPND